MQFNLFLQTFYQYAVIILPWVLFGILIAYLLNKHLNAQKVKKYLGSSGKGKIVSAVLLGMISPLSIMSFLPVAEEFIDLGAQPRLLFGFLVAERAYDLQSIFIISSLFGIKFAVLNFSVIFISLYLSVINMRNKRIVFSGQKDGKHNHFWLHQIRLLLIVVTGILLSAFLRSFIPQQEFQQVTGNPVGGILGGLVSGFILYLGPVIANYPIAKAFFDLGMSVQGVFVFLTISPVLNFVIIILFGGAIGYRQTLKSFFIYTCYALFLTMLISPLL